MHTSAAPFEERVGPASGSTHTSYTHMHTRHILSCDMLHEEYVRVGHMTLELFTSEPRTAYGCS